MSIFNRWNKSKPREIGSLGDMGLMLQSERGTAFSRLRSDNFEENAICNKISNDVKETIYFFEPLTYAGINNTSSKLFGSWFDMDMPEEGETMDVKKKQDLMHFHESIGLKSKLMFNANDSMTYGNGYLEMTGERGEQDSMQPMFPEDGLKNIDIIDPIYISEKVEPIPTRVNNRKNEVYYIHRDNRGGYLKIHSSRMVHVPWAKLGTMRFGKGVIEIGIRTMLAKIGMDWAIGEIIYRYGKPFLVLKTTGATPKEYEKSVEVLKHLNPHTGFAGTERHEFSILNPSTIDPDPFAKYYYINQARALEMPMMIFIGVQKGAVTGSEVDFQDWYQTLNAKQESRYTDPLNRINNQYLKGDWIEKIYWNIIYVDQKVEWETILNKAKTLDFLNRQNSLMLTLEARQWCRDNGIPFPEDDKAFEAEEEDTEGWPDVSEIPDPFSQETEEKARKQKLIERLKDDEFKADQEIFRNERNATKKKK